MKNSFNIIIIRIIIILWNLNYKHSIIAKCSEYRGEILTINLEFHYFTNYAKLINHIFVKCWFDHRLFPKKKNAEGQKIKDTHFIGVRVGCLKINRNSDKENIFGPTKILFTC